MIRKISTQIDTPKRDCIYDILSYWNLRLCIDVGAAAGHNTKRMSLMSNENTTIIAYEPFPGNHSHFEKAFLKIDKKAQLVKKAVSNSIGNSKFIVNSTVKGNELGWNNYEGYSSVGYLENEATHSETHVYPEKQTLMVETTTIDHDFPKEYIDFIKIDVQGAEEKVLLGAANALAEKRIGALYIEWSGEPEVVDILSYHDYILFDSTYIIGSYGTKIEPFEKIGFKFLEEVNLSIGSKAFEMVISDESISPAKAMKQVKEQKLGWIQTDLIAISPKRINDFLKATRSFNTNE